MPRCSGATRAASELATAHAGAHTETSEPNATQGMSGTVSEMLVRRIRGKWLRSLSPSLRLRSSRCLRQCTIGTDGRTIERRCAPASSGSLLLRAARPSFLPLRERRADATRRAPQRRAKLQRSQRAQTTPLMRPSPRRHKESVDASRLPLCSRLGRQAGLRRLGVYRSDRRFRMCRTTGRV